MASSSKKSSSTSSSSNSSVPARAIAPPSDTFAATVRRNRSKADTIPVSPARAAIKIAGKSEKSDFLNATPTNSGNTISPRALATMNAELTAPVT